MFYHLDCNWIAKVMAIFLCSCLYTFFYKYGALEYLSNVSELGFFICPLWHTHQTHTMGSKQKKTNQKQNCSAGKKETKTELICKQTMPSLNSNFCNEIFCCIHLLWLRPSWQYGLLSFQQKDTKLVRFLVILKVKLLYSAKI